MPGHCQLCSSTQYCEVGLLKRCWFFYFEEGKVLLREVGNFVKFFIHHFPWHGEGTMMQRKLTRSGRRIMNKWQRAVVSTELAWHWKRIWGFFSRKVRNLYSTFGVPGSRYRCWCRCWCQCRPQDDCLHEHQGWRWQLQIWVKALSPSSCV